MAARRDAKVLNLVQQTERQARRLAAVGAHDPGAGYWPDSRTERQWSQLQCDAYDMVRDWCMAKEVEAIDHGAAVDLEFARLHVIIYRLMATLKSQHAERSIRSIAQQIGVSEEAFWQFSPYTWKPASQIEDSANRSIPSPRSGLE